jgi:arylsulfotransferase ASST
MRVSTPGLLFGCLLLVGFSCAKNDGVGGTGGAGDTGGSSATGGSSTGGSTGTGGNGQTGGNTGTGGNGPGTGGIVSTGGSPGTGGTKATGGSTGTGGKATGGSTGTGGSATGGSTGTGGSATGGSTGTGGAVASCTITPTATLSTKIATVGIVTFTTTLASPTSASIKFGLDTSYGLTAPVDLKQTNYRTLLLGMKPSKTYHYQITVTNSSGSCTSADQMIATGAQLNGLPTFTITPTTKSAALYPGFIVTGTYTQSGGAPAYILDSDGSYVWWYNDGSDACGARMSYDGQYMWIASANVPDATGGDHVHRVTMDGLTDTDFTTAFAHHSHQVTPLPDGSVAFYATGTNKCDDIKIFPANGTPTTVATTLVNARTAHGGDGPCHVNNIEYSPTDDALIFSDLDNSCLTKVDRKTGATIWVLNGGSPTGVTSTFTGDLYKGGEHGFHVISVMGSINDILLFNNNSCGTSSGCTGGAQALEFALDTSAKTSKKIWSYQPSPAINVMVLGDVQRLPNGNTIVDFGTGTKIQEVDKSGTVLQQIAGSVSFGFFEKRATLYGPSTK